MGAGWSIGNGEKVRFRWDCWAVKTRPLIDFAIAPVSEDVLYEKVADFVSLDNQWKWLLFSHLLSNHIILKIASIQPPNPTRGQDQIYWSASSKVVFTVKSTYHYLAGSQYEGKDSSWLLAWRWKGLQAVRTFLWTVMHDRLKTRLELKRRHFDSDGICDRCGFDLEGTLHVLRVCPVAKRI